MQAYCSLQTERFSVSASQSPFSGSAYMSGTMASKIPRGHPAPNDTDLIPQWSKNFRNGYGANRTSIQNGTIDHFCEGPAIGNRSLLCWTVLFFIVHHLRQTIDGETRAAQRGVLHDGFNNGICGLGVMMSEEKPSCVLSFWRKRAQMSIEPLEVLTNNHNRAAC